MTYRRLVTAFAAAAMTLVLASGLTAQVGKGLMDLNSAAEKDLLTLPNVTPAIAKALMDKRPFASITDAQTFLLAQGLTAAQTAELYGKAFVHLNLNTATSEQVMLVPKIGRNMPHEFEEYRPWKTWTQFDREIGKYVRQNPGELERMKQYVFIPLDANTATDADLQTIPNLSAASLAAINAGRPWKTMDALTAAIAKASNAKEGTRVARFLVVVP
jgi:DNA uptake protein ComE-like DNA-binding protein